MLILAVMNRIAPPETSLTGARVRAVATRRRKLMPLLDLPTRVAIDAPGGGAPAARLRHAI
jgi:hypothetical protein